MGDEHAKRIKSFTRFFQKIAGVEGAAPLIALDGQKYILDMHIKHGVSAACLLRVYFCYDETLQKLIIFPERSSKKDSTLFSSSDECFLYFNYTYVF